MRTCLKCGTQKDIENHHIFPVVFFKRKGNYRKVPLCSRCHLKIENNIKSVESFVGNTKYGQRFELPEEDYMKILRNFVPAGNLTPHAQYSNATFIR